MGMCPTSHYDTPIRPLIERKLALINQVYFKKGALLLNLQLSPAAKEKDRADRSCYQRMVAIGLPCKLS